MKINSLKLITLLGLLAAWGCTSTGQLAQNNAEYDDLYFSSKDKEAAVASAKASQAQISEASSSYNQSIPQSNQDNAGIDFDNTNINSQYGENQTDNYNSSAYFDPNYQDRNPGVYTSPTTGFNYNLGYTNTFRNSPWYGNGTSWSVGIGNTWGSPFNRGFNSFYDPFNPFNPYVGFNSFYNPYRALASPYYGGFGYDPFIASYYGGGLNAFYCPPFFNNRNTVIVTNTNNGESTVRSRYYGPRYNRGGSAVVSNQGARTRTRQSRTQPNNGTVKQNNSTANSSTNTRTRSRTYSQTRPNTSRSTTVTPRSNNRTNSTRTQSRTRSNSNRTYTPSRSRSNSNRTYTPSRSNSSRSRSTTVSPSRSRSSSSSSGSRSSGSSSRTRRPR